MAGNSKRLFIALFSVMLAGDLLLGMYDIKKSERIVVMAEGDVSAPTDGAASAPEDNAGVEEYPVHINVYMADDARSKEDGNLENTPASGVGIILREGAGTREGDALLTLQAGENGGLDAVLPSGTYTAQIDAPGCARTFMEIHVDDRETSADGYVLRSLEEGMTGVVLTWTGAGADLDLTLFTPFHGEDGGMARIGGQTMGDEYGNFLMSDNSAGCEVIYVNTAQDGSYKVYVNDYTNSRAGNYSSDMLGKSNIHIYIYDSTGLAAEYAFPAGQTGVMWEVAEISGSRITPSRKMYDKAEGESWRLEEKRKKRLVKANYYRGNGNLYNLICSNDYIYDSKLNLEKIVCAKFNYWPNAAYTHYHDYKEQIYSYDDQGCLTKRVADKGRYAIGSWVEDSYDSQGNLTKSANYNPDGSMAWDGWTEYSYDGQGRLLKSISLNASNDAKDWTEYSYDDQGRLTRKAVSHWGQFGGPEPWSERSEGEEYSYDSRGSLIKKRVYGTAGSTYYEDYDVEYANEYDSHGNLIKSDGSVQAENEKSGLRELREYDYDIRGSLIKESYYTYNNNNLTNLTEKSYDEKGNIIEEIEYSYDWYEWEKVEYIYE